MEGRWNVDARRGRCAVCRAARAVLAVRAARAGLATLRDGATGAVAVGLVAGLAVVFAAVRDVVVRATS